MPIASTSAATRNYLSVLQEAARRKEAERDRKIGNIYGGIRGFTGAQRTGQIQDDIAALQSAQTELMRPYSQGVGGTAAGIDGNVGVPPAGGADIAPTQSALSKLDTGGWMGRFYGGLEGPEAYMRQMAPQIRMAQQIDAGEMGRQRSAYEELVQMREEQDKRRYEREMAEMRAQQQQDLLDQRLDATSTEGVLDRDFRSSEAEKDREARRAMWELQQAAKPPEPTLEDRVAEREALAAASARGTASVQPPDVIQTPEERLAQLEAESAARARGTASVRPDTPATNPEIRIRRDEVSGLEVELRRIERVAATEVNPIKRGMIEEQASKLRVQLAVSRMLENDANQQDIHRDPFLGLTPEEIGLAKQMMSGGGVPR